MASMTTRSLKKYHIIYQTTNLINNMIYIGAHSTDCIDDGYIGSGHRITLALQKYGVSNFRKDVLYVFDTPDEMFKKEAEIVNLDFLKRRDVYNIVEGGFGGYNKGTKGLKHLHHPDSGKRCAVHPTTIPRMIEEGWKLGRNMSSTTNKIWIYKDENKKMIESRFLEDYLTDGWKKGLPKSPTAGKIWIFNSNTAEYTLCHPSELDSRLSEGWVKKKWAPVKKGLVWINNETDNLRIEIDELDDYISAGWKKGLLTSRW